ncbi:MAG: hypothetical protein L3K00_04675 [Thermoplasmata archaeon]|nr:hypothetical protein [Thermoplasmata archaeon]MCI4362150.1 hypothetical protein [Thermoplasmata archaeon]
MAPATLPELESFARNALGARLDAAALTAAYQEYLPRRVEPIAKFQFLQEGGEPKGLFAAIGDPRFDFGKATLQLIDPPPAGPAWEFLRPFSRMVFASDGSADVYDLDGAHATRGIVRVLLREHYAPPVEGRAPKALRAATRALATPQRAVEYARQTGVAPFSIVLLLYFSEERIRYELDVLEDRLLRDIRAGRFPLSRRVRRPPRVSYGVDSYIARGGLPVVSSRVLEVVTETHGTSAVELAPVFGGARELVQTTLHGLAARRLASFDRRTGLFRPRLETFLPEGERSEAAENLPAMENPQLRTSVIELISAADSRATCPLCGDSLPSGHRGLLCARCEAEVAADPGST